MNKPITSFNNARVIVSNEAIPNSALGSWTQRIEYLLSQFVDNNIDYLLSPSPNTAFVSSSTKQIVCTPLKQEINRQWFYPYKYRLYIKAISRIIESHDYVVITVVDHIKLKNIISQVIEKNGWQLKCRLVFLQCGFSYEFNRDEYRDFRQGLHEIVLLTQKSYLHEMGKYHEYPFLVHVLNNPIRKDIFFRLQTDERSRLRNQLGLAESEQVFLWVAHDRPKKGLEIILRMWPLVVAKYPGARLLVIGASRTMELPGLRFIGKLANTEIARYYQAADVYLFSSLCQEGFGLSLAEALSCGCFCIASDVGGVSEFFSAGNGLLVKHPNQVEAWQDAIDRYFGAEVNQQEGSQTRLLTYDEWCGRFINIINNSIQFLIQSSNR